LPYRVLVFLLVSLLGLSRCNLEDGSNSEQEETAYDYSSLVAMHPDTLTRPNLQWISSYRLPGNQYGFHLAFDGSDSTYWSTAPGLNHLEGFEWQFNRPQNLGQICIKTCIDCQTERKLTDSRIKKAIQEVNQNIIK
jgi:hypothetical protein